MAVYATNSALGNSLQQLLLCDEIVAGAEPSYEMCKIIYLYHPIGQKMAESPIRVAQSLPREISIGGAPDAVREAFLDQWSKDEVDKNICNVSTQSRVYGISSLAVAEEGVLPSQPLDLKRLATAELSFSVFDPLNTAGSLVLNQNPNAIDFQKHRDISVNGVRYHRSRAVVLMNEQPIYIAWSSSAFGFVGRSVYQRALFPLKSFVQTMRADDMVARKVGLLVATLKMASNVVDRVMAAGARLKRFLLKEAETDNVISIAEGETVTSIDLTNLSEPLSQVRRDILENIAAADDMPAKMLNNETFAEGFGEGTEDAKRVAAYIETKRQWMRPVYDFMDNITMHRAWNDEFIEVQKKLNPELRKYSNEQIFYQWKNNFRAAWPSLIREPESERVRVEETKFKSAAAMFEIMSPILDPENKATMVEWIIAEINNAKLLFSAPLVLDIEALKEYEPPVPVMGEETTPEKEPKAPRPFHDSVAVPSDDVQGRVATIETFLRAHGRKLARAR